MAGETFKEALKSANQGEHFPVMRLTRQNPEMAAILSKTIRGNNAQNYDDKGNISPHTPDVSQLKQIGQRKAQDIIDAKTVLQVLPDLKRTKQILVSSVLAPKDMVTVELNYTSAEGLLPPEVSSEMMNAIKAHLEKDYKITPKLADILGKAIFDEGAYPIAVIPENTLDDVINGGRQISMEMIQEHFDKSGNIRPLSILGPAIKSAPTPTSMSSVSLESFSGYHKHTDIDQNVTLSLAFEGKPQETFITVCDNPAILNVPRLKQRLREQKVQQALGGNRAAMESHKNPMMNDRQLVDLIYKNRAFKYNPITTLKTQDQLNRRAVGEPLVMHIPPQALLPVFMPGNVSQHLGYFMITDGEGNPVTNATEYQQSLDMGSRLSSASSFPSVMLNKVKGEMNGFDPMNQQHLDFSARVFGEMVEQELLARLRNGAYGEGASIAKRESIYRIMFARALAKQHTQLVFLPAELVTYIAFEYDENGVGESMLDQMKVTNGLRSALLFSNVMAGIKNSIGRTEVKIKLDEKDPDPFKSEEIIRHEVVRSRQKTLPPVGMTSPTDIVDHLNLASLEFITEGHPGMPDVRVDFGEKSNQYVKPDTDLADSLRKDSIMSSGVPPELVDSGIPIEFATTAVSNNILLSKQVINIQDVFTPQLSDHMRKYMGASENLWKELLEILVKNKDKLDTRIEEFMKDKQYPSTVKKEEVEMFIITEFLKQFIAGFEANLPRPNSVTLENQLAAMEVYGKALDAALDNIIADAFFTSESGGEVAQQTGMVRAIVKARFMQKYMADNGILPELSGITATNEDGSPTMELYDGAMEHIESLTKHLTAFMVGLQPVKRASDTVLQAKVGEMEASGGGSSDDTGGGGSSDDEFGGGGGGNDNDLDLGGNDFGGGLNDGNDATAEPAVPEPDAGGTDNASATDDAAAKPEGEEPPKDGNDKGKTDDGQAS